MIRRFEEYTKDLTEYERDILLPVVIRGMEVRVGKENAITNAAAIAKLQSKGYVISDSRFRKLMHVIRVSGMLPGVVASSKGYYVANDDSDIQDYIESLADRIEHITALKDALIKQRNEYRT